MHLYASLYKHLPVREAVDWGLMEVVKEVPVTVDDLLHEVEGAILDANTQQLDNAGVSAVQKKKLSA